MENVLSGSLKTADGEIARKSKSSWIFLWAFFLLLEAGVLLLLVKRVSLYPHNPLPLILVAGFGAVALPFIWIDTINIKAKLDILFQKATPESTPGLLIADHSNYVKTMMFFIASFILLFAVDTISRH
jgi:hypothetical protein